MGYYLCKYGIYSECIWWRFAISNLREFEFDKGVWVCAKNAEANGELVLYTIEYIYVW